MSTAAETKAYDETGAGGKFRRKPLRKSQATPYDRPPIAIRNTSSSSGSGNGWLSKIIDPASKLINASAHRLFGLAFRKRLLPPPQQQMLPPPQQQMLPPPQQQMLPPPQQQALPSPQQQMLPSTPRQDASELNRITDSVQRSGIQFKVGDQSGTNHHTIEHVSLDIDGGNQGISELEKILAQKTFTESEINRLTALLNSRTIKGEGEIESEERVPKTIFENENSSKFKSPLFPDNGYNSTRCTGAATSLISKAKAIDYEIATPAELAKAYMGSRPSKVSPSMLASRSQARNKDLPLINSVVFPSQSPSMGSANKSLARVSTPENGYMTPRLRGRSSLYSMVRTPYSRSQKGPDITGVNSYIFESPQLALEANKISSSRQTTLKRRSNVLEDVIGSAGPIRRIRQRPSLLSSKQMNEPAGGSLSTNGPGVLSNYRLKNVQSKTPNENFMSVPSQSSVVAQKILQQLDKLSPSPKEKSSEHKSVVPPGKSAFTLSHDILSGQALISRENAESSKIIVSSQEKSKVNNTAQSLAANEEFTVLNGKKQLEENGPLKPTITSKSNFESALNSLEHPLAKNEQAFQDNNPQIKSDQNGTLPNESIKFGKEGKVSYSSGYPTMPIQPTTSDNASFSFFGKVSSEEQTTLAPQFGHGAKVANTFSPFTFTSSSPTANYSQSLQTSSLPESRTSNSSGLSPSDTPKTNPGDSMITQGAGSVAAKPSTASNGISTTPAHFSLNAFGNNGYTNSSFPVQPASASSQISSAGTQNNNSLTTSLSAASVPNAATGNTSTGVSLFSASPVFGNSLRKDPQVSSNVNGLPSGVVIEKPIPAVNNTISNPFGSDGSSSAAANGSNVFSALDSSMSSPKLVNQGIGTVSNAESGQAKNITTVADSIPQNSLFKFGSSGLSSVPAFGLSWATNSAPANSITSIPAPVFGQNSTPSSNEAGPMGSDGGSSNSLFGSNWKSNSSPLFGSTTSSSTVPQSVFHFGSPAALSAPAPASATFSVTSAATSGFPSLFSAPQPVTASTTKPVFTFGSSASPPNTNNNNQTSMEDTMAEDTVQTSAPSTSVFGQPPSSSNGVFTFGSPSPSVTPGTGVFQFGGQPSLVSSLNQAPLQASGSFNAGGGFSVGKTDDKSQRKIVKVKRNANRR